MRERRDDLEKSEVELSTLAENTNGTILIPLDGFEMVEKAARIASFIDASYVVTYEPKVPVKEGGAERLITVTSRRPGLIIQAKRRFVKLAN
jgi:hypothetical protein